MPALRTVSLIVLTGRCSPIRREETLLLHNRRTNAVCYLRRFVVSRLTNSLLSLWPILNSRGIKKRSRKNYTLKNLIFFSFFF